jgi:glucose-1-phosphate cytidylyltransferase
MNIYAAHGVHEFVALGYRAEVVKEYFLNFYAINNDISIDLRRARRPFTMASSRTGVICRHRPPHANGRPLGACATGWVDDDTFMMTHGDGLANVDLTADGISRSTRRWQP